MHTLYTYGYLGSEPETLRRHTDVLDALVVDIRYSPRSRVGHWNRGPLERLLAQRYVYVHALGNRNYKGTGPIEFEDLAGGVDEVFELLQEQSVILLCACRDVQTCHRMPAAEAIARRGKVNIVHL